MRALLRIAPAALGRWTIAELRAAWGVTNGPIPDELQLAEEPGENGVYEDGTMMNIFNDRTDRFMICQYDYPRAILEKSSKTIQRYWRGYSMRKLMRIAPSSLGRWSLSHLHASAEREKQRLRSRRSEREEWVRAREAGGFMSGPCTDDMF